MKPERDRVALLDLDGTVADYDRALETEQLRLQAPGEPAYQPRQDFEPSYLEARRKLITSKVGFWKNLEKIELGFDVIAELRDIGFLIHVLTKGPKNNPQAWMGKVKWCQEHLPDVLVTVTQDKSMAYGRVLVDDYPPYFRDWLAVRPRGKVICVAQPWNIDYAKGGRLSHPNIFRWDGSDRSHLRNVLQHAFDRISGTDKVHEDKS